MTRDQSFGTEFWKMCPLAMVQMLLLLHQIGRGHAQGCLRDMFCLLNIPEGMPSGERPGFGVRHGRVKLAFTALVAVELEATELGEQVHAPRS